ncbi:MAG: hypothetical protein OES47_00785 [Acidobacteriota bacterium]|nr:hypothetical protein [Acidobacteriota bacterium]
MANGYEEAREQRNWLEKLGAKIPGFRGFFDRELRRDVDRMQRDHISRELGRIKSAVRSKARDYTDAGQIGLLHLFERIDRKLDGLSQAVRFADYGATGIFDVVKIGEEELERLYAFDLSLLEDVSSIDAEIRALPGPQSGAAAAAKVAVDDALENIVQLADKWADRETVMSNVVQR